MNRLIQPESDTHWQKNFSDAIPKIKIREAEKFFKPVIPILEKKGYKVLDAGFPDGVHYRLIKSLNNDQLTYTGIEISATAIYRLRVQNSSL